MDAYFDSAIIVKLYVQEATSAQAIQLVGRYSAPYLLTTWQALEVKNAIRLKAFRGEITETEMSQSIGAFDNDIATGRWKRSPYDTAAIEAKAQELSSAHSVAIGCRTLDIIHVAAAIVLASTDFVTFDSRQTALAKAAGLNAMP